MIRISSNYNSKISVLCKTKQRNQLREGQSNKTIRFLPNNYMTMINVPILVKQNQQNSNEVVSTPLRHTIALVSCVTLFCRL